MVTVPGFFGRRKCLWLPRVLIRYQPSRSTTRMASLTFGGIAESREQIMHPARRRVARLLRLARLLQGRGAVFVGA